MDNIQTPKALLSYNASLTKLPFIFNYMIGLCFITYRSLGSEVKEK